MCILIMKIRRSLHASKWRNAIVVLRKSNNTEYVTARATVLVGFQYKRIDFVSNSVFRLVICNISSVVGSKFVNKPS